MFRYVFASLVLIGSISPPQLQNETSATLARAEMLYFEARFRESIELLLPLDLGLRSETNRTQEKVNVKLQLALAHIGLTETSQAKTRFAELLALDPDYSLDPQKFSDNVISLFEEAKKEQGAAICRTICTEADRLLENGDVQALVAKIESAGQVCLCLQATALDAADRFYEQGVDAYKEDDLSSALENFRTALKLNPQHDLAATYVELTQGKLRLAADRLLLEWRTNFDARAFPLAAAVYYRLQSFNVEGSATQALDQMRGQYRQSLSALVEASKRACDSGDGVTMENLRRQAAELLPDPAIGQDLLTQMATCMNKNCLQMSAQLAFVRLKTRVDPQFPNGLGQRSVSVRVKARIDEKGNVTVGEALGGTPVIRSAVQKAVEQWKFLPAIVESAPRCVETEFPIVINR